MDSGAADPGSQDAETFGELFRTAYLTFHRRDRPRTELAGASRGVLMHLATTGPLTIGEAAEHLDRTQSVISEIVAGLAHKGLLLRESDPADRRRTLIWLTDAGFELLRRDSAVLEPRLVAAAMAELTATERSDLNNLLRALVRAAPTRKEARNERTSERL